MTYTHLVVLTHARESHPLVDQGIVDQDAESHEDEGTDVLGLRVQGDGHSCDYGRQDDQEHGDHDRNLYRQRSMRNNDARKVLSHLCIKLYVICLYIAFYGQENKK